MKMASTSSRKVVVVKQITADGWRDRYDVERIWLNFVMDGAGQTK